MSQFKKIYDDLLSRGRISNKSDMARDIGSYSYMVNSYITGKRQPGVPLLLKLYEVYNINPLFLFGMESNIYYHGKAKDDDPY